MKNQEVLKGYDDLIEGKKQSKFAMILIVIFSIIISLSALSFALITQLKAIDTVKVMDSTGRYVKTDSKREEQVLRASVQSHLENVIYNLNSFDALSINENKAKAIFLVDKASADRVFNSFAVSGAYNDAIQGGVIYSAKMDKITVFEGQSEPFYFEVEATLTIKKGNKELKNLIKGKGKIRFTTPNYPNNTQGLQVYDYLQEFEPINTQQDEQEANNNM